MERMTVTLVFVLALLAGVVLLQVHLCKRGSKWPGLVLPVIGLLFGLLVPLNMADHPGRDCWGKERRGLLFERGPISMRDLSKQHWGQALRLTPILL